jgi:RNA 2',3'-cyclic 3'-phosphodiesterase
MQAADASATRQRLFVAIPCPLSLLIKNVLDELRIAQCSQNSGLRVVASDTLHITLKFLGATAEERIPAICDVLTQQARMHKTFSVELAGAGSFHSALWLGVAPQPQLLALAQGIDAALESSGFAADAKAFRPHVTLARLNRNPRFDRTRWLQQHRETTWGTVAVEDVRLYRSETRPEGARYSIIHSAALR